MNFDDVPVTKGGKVPHKHRGGTTSSPAASSARLFALLFALCLFFPLFSLTLRFLQVEFNDFAGLTSLLRLFDVDQEGSIPTWYSSQILFLCSGVLYLIFTHKHPPTGPYGRYWLGLAVVFLAFSVDEIVSFHEETVGYALQRALDLSGVLYFGWVLPAAALIAIFSGTYLRFFLNLPARTRSLFLVAALLYVGGAFGVELLGGYYVDTYGPDHIAYAGITTVEEGMEMLGAVLFLYALADYRETLGRAPLSR